MKAVNLLPQDLRSADRRTPGSPRENAGAFAVLGFLALALVAVVATVLASNSIKANERALRSVQADQQVAQREVDSLASYGTFQDLAVKRLTTVRQLATARFDWEQALRDLSRAVPRDVTLDQIAGTVAPNANAGGASANPLRASIAAPAIELTGCAPGQLQVARLMARLRAVQGVTRVSLASSQKEETDPVAPGGQAAPTTAGEKPEGCGKGPQPEFQIVIFFEGASAAPAGSAPTAATPATPATPPAGSTAAPAATPSAGQSAAPAATPAATPAAAGQTAANPSSTTKEVASR